MKTLEGILAKTDVDGGEGKVSSELISCHASLAGRKADGKAEYDINKVLRDGRGGSTLAGCVESYPRERHFLPSGGIELAIVRTGGAEEEV